MSVPNRLRFEVFRRDAFRCRYCGVSAAVAPLQIEHVTPTALGGQDTFDNLVTSCALCNHGKSSMLPDKVLYAALEATEVPEVPAAKYLAWSTITTYGVREVITRPMGGTYGGHEITNCLGMWCGRWGGSYAVDPSVVDQTEFERGLADACRAAYPVPILYSASCWAGDDRTTDISGYARVLHHAVAAELNSLPA